MAAPPTAQWAFPVTWGMPAFFEEEDPLPEPLPDPLPEPLPDPLPDVAVGVGVAPPAPGVPVPLPAEGGVVIAAPLVGAAPAEPPIELQSKLVVWVSVVEKVTWPFMSVMEQDATVDSRNVHPSNKELGPLVKEYVNDDGPWIRVAPAVPNGHTDWVLHSMR